MSQFVRRVKQHEHPAVSRFAQVDIELTERCNNDCIHCCVNLPIGDKQALSREMTTAQVRNILDQAVALGCLRVRFTGGEPLLRGDFEELYLHARRSGLKVVLFTNGRLVTPRLAELLATIPPLEPIEVSVYGMHPNSYEAVTRTPGSFAEFWRGVNLLLEHHVPFIVKSAILPQNKADMDEFESWAERIPWMRRRPGYAMFFDLRYRRDDADKDGLIRSLRAEPKRGVSLLGRNRAEYARELVQFSHNFMGPQGDRLFRCGAGCSVCVDAYGQAQPCLPLRAQALTYDLRAAGASLQEALGRFRRLRNMTAVNPDYLERCARCFLKGLCEQCPAKSWIETGTLDTPVKFLCDVAHAQARDMGWLGEEEHAWEVRQWAERIEQGRPAERQLCGAESR